jgi:16S rRNA (cytosine1402-N4)-methyltransferase
MAQQRHVPVMLDRVVALIAPALVEPGSVLVDATVGLGGHAAAILSRCPEARLVGLDRDEQALALAAETLEPFTERTTLVHAVYDQVGDVLADLGHDRVNGVLFDLGVSSVQLDEVDRGFSYAHDAPLDMRMDPSRGQTAADVLNTYSADELARVISRYGEERFARRIAERVVRERAKSPLTSSARLVELIREAVPAPARRTGGNPAKRTFQALRVEVNDELGALRSALPAAIDALAVGGRVVVMSYQSLEDRIVKHTLQRRSTSTAPPDLPIPASQIDTELTLLTRGAETASADEVAANPRAASVRLRAAERRRQAA